jgi:hypothetical protein
MRNCAPPLLWLAKWSQQILLAAILSAIPLLLTSSSQAGVIGLLELWPNDQPISVCFMGGSTDLRNKVIELANQWTQGIGVSFAFDSVIKSCDAHEPRDIRIAFKDGEGRWSFNGIDARSVPNEAPTMNLDGLADADASKFEYIVLHAFGLALGLRHQEQTPQSGCKIIYDTQALQAAGWSRDQLVGATLPDNGNYLATPFTTRSVMKLDLPSSMLEGGSKSPCYGEPAHRLTADDHLLVQLAYPEKPADVNQANEPQVLVLLQSQLTPEHFGYVLSALYRVNAITLYQRVATKGTSLAEVLRDEDLAPDGSVSQSLDVFLCSINPHICTNERGHPVWVDVPAEINYRPTGLKCPDRRLPRYIYCVPNIRLASFLYRTMHHYSSRDDHNLADYVVNKLQGCTTWDKTCISKIKRLNYNLADQFVSGNEVFAADFAGDIQLLQRGYRLVLQYADKAQLTQIASAIDTVKAERARALGIPIALVGIQLTLPVGQASPQQAPTAVVTTATDAPDPLRIMHFNQQLFPHLRAGDVEVWDNILDINCDLSPLTVSYLPASHSDIAASPPRDQQGNCMSAPPDDRFSDFYDHATAIVSILSGQGRGKAIRGIWPKMRVWVWDSEDFKGLNKSKEDPMSQINDIDQSFGPTVLSISLTTPPSDSEREVAGIQPIHDMLHTFLFSSGTSDQIIRVGITQTVLVVAAAGVHVDDHRNPHGKEIPLAKRDDCNAYPACWSADDEGAAVVSVVALNSTGDGLLLGKSAQDLGTDFGTSFDVAAVGNVVSTVYGGYVRAVSGSSFATPYVSGLASLIAGRAGVMHYNVMPATLKERLLFTADLLPQLGRLVRFGRINFDRALAFDHSLIVKVGQDNCQDIDCAEQVDLSYDPALELMVSSADTESGRHLKNKEIEWIDILRLAKIGDTYTIIYKTDHKLNLLRNAHIESFIRGPLKQRRANTTDPYQDLDLATIGDYTACSFRDGCGGEE